jgi:ABC-type bacteriocin/lantibiotic exporter with double-glycine peptidase domain
VARGSFNFLGQPLLIVIVIVIVILLCQFKAIKIKIRIKRKFASCAKNNHKWTQRMAAWPTTFERFLATARNYLRRHWQKALQVRERLWLSQEALHLLMAGVVGLMGGVINVSVLPGDRRSAGPCSCGIPASPSWKSPNC